MDIESSQEMFRSGTDKFYKNLGEFLALKKQDNWEVENCTFFDQKDKEKMLAWCLFKKISGPGS